MFVVPLFTQLLTKRDKRELALLLLASMLVSLIETIGVSALMVFVSISTNLTIIENNPYFAYWFHLLPFKKHSSFVICFGFLLIFFYILRAFINVAHIYYLNRFAQMRQYDFASKAFAHFLKLPFGDFALKNNTTVAHLINTTSMQITHVISGILAILAESSTIIAIYAMLFYVNWKMTLILTLLLSVKVFVIIKTFSHRIKAAGKQLQGFSLARDKKYQQVFGNYKFIKLLSNNQQHTEIFNTNAHGFARANNINMVWQSLPRFILETIGFCMLIGVIVYVLFRYNNAHFVLPIVSMYALAFYRFLPSITKILTSYNQIAFNKHAIKPFLAYLETPTEQLSSNPIIFNTAISLANINFSYIPNKPILNNVSLHIRKGEKIGFIGESGAGKTTLIDILVGLLPVSNGSLYVDNTIINSITIKAWRQQIGYIPQHIYLFDGTVAENIVCGRTADEAQIIQVLKQARLYDLIMEKGGLQTQIGESGIQLSGGQRQRVAIARALYGNPGVLVLDEATSSLDEANEEHIMQEIYDHAAGKTLFIIAHRLSTISRCDRVFKVEDGNVLEVSLGSVLAAPSHREHQP
ncbi:ABC transporter ATP-binding protein [Candidatus Dependentiae bacterium]|nr:ABC transporter ATP-binding protein [Candidatus Dependentiae bacterium]